MGVFPRIRHQRARGRWKDRFGDRAPAEVGQNLHARSREPPQRAVGAGLPHHGAPGGDDRRHGDRAPGQRLGQSAALAQRGMRAADGHKVNRLGAVVQGRPARRHVGAGHPRPVGVGGDAMGFGGHPLDMQHGRGGGRAEGCADRLEVLGRGVRRAKAAQQRNAVGCSLAGEPAEQGPEGIVDALGQFDIEDAPRLAWFVQIDAGARGAARHRDAEVQEIRVLGSPRAQNAVGIDDGVRLGPGDGLALGRCRVEQVGRAGEGRLAPHADIGIGQALRRAAEAGRHALGAPVRVIDRDRIHRCRDADLGAHVGHLLGEGQVGGAGIDAAVDMALTHIDQLGCALIGGHGAEDAHGLRHRLALGPLQHRAVARGQVERCRRGRGERKRRVVGDDLGLGDARGLGLREAVEGVAREAQHGDRLAEHRGPDHRAQCRHIFGLGKDQRGRGMAVQDHVQKHARPGAGAARARHDEDAPRDAFPASGW